jgi:hypothetical protein
MDTPIARVTAEAARSAIAHGYLNARRAAAANSYQLGSVELRPHQADAVERLRDILNRSHGALLADEVGLGKTYTALALAAEAQRALIVAPAVLTDMWHQACATADLHTCSFLSHETLSRRSRPLGKHDLVIVDEAHHARNPATHRYAELARVCAGARVLLLSATPIHNTEGDLRALFALFWGSRAWTCSLDEIGRAIVRRGKSVVESRMIPVATEPCWLTLPPADDLLQQIIALPPPLPPSDGGDGGALIAFGLVRQWASSNAALLKAVVRRRARALALIAALEEGRYPSTAELRTWSCTDDSLQMAFAALLPPVSGVTAPLLEAVRVHETALAALQGRISAGSDTSRVEHLMALWGKHPGARIVAFTQFADTAQGLFRLVAPYGRVALLTGRGAITVSGRLSRQEVLNRFNNPSVHAAEQIDLLLTTDLLSEGVNLPEVSVVLHLDLPWTPARLEQRVGRALRFGSRHADVHVYCMAPPASAEALLHVESTIRRKLGDAARSVGISGAILPSLTARSEPTPPSHASSPEAEEQIRALLGRWLPTVLSSEPAEILVGCVHSAVSGWIALVDEAERSALLVACGDTAISERPAEVLAVLRQCDGADRAGVAPSPIQAALSQLDYWMRCRTGSRSAGLAEVPNVRAGARLLRRIDNIASRTPLHRRAKVVALAGSARQAVLNRQGIGTERLLHDLANSALGDEAWLEAVGAFGKHTRPDSSGAGNYRVRALLILGTS